MKTTWILVADASRARVISLQEKDKDWTVVEEIDNPAGRARTNELVVDKPGRVRQSGTGSQRTMDPHTDPDDVEEEKFAHRLAGIVEKGFDTNRFGRLALVAPPRFLGLLRKELGDPVRGSVVAEIKKDLTQLNLRDLRPRLADEI